MYSDLNLTDPDPTLDTVMEVLRERKRQDKKWGQQNHSDGTGLPGDVAAAQEAKDTCERAFKHGTGTWRDILEEEVKEAYAESDEDKLYTELIQVSAVACGWAEAIRRRQEKRASAQGKKSPNGQDV